jgi:hypothetical protein
MASDRSWTMRRLSAVQNYPHELRVAPARPRATDVAAAYLPVDLRETQALDWSASGPSPTSACCRTTRASPCAATEPHLVSLPVPGAISEGLWNCCAFRADDLARSVVNDRELPIRAKLNIEGLWKAIQTAAGVRSHFTKYDISINIV